MVNINRTAHLGSGKDIIIRILIMMLIPFLISTIWLREVVKEEKRVSEALSITINNKTSEMETLKVEMENSKSYISQLEKEKLMLEAQLSEALENIIISYPSDFKSYMPYTSITDKTTIQWQLQQKATTNKNGLRCIEGTPLVAIGTGWDISVGEKATVYLDNGNTFEIIVGDIKKNKHTDNANKATIANGCMVEFIVDIPKLPQTIQISGNLSNLQRYNGVVINIVKK